MPATNHRLHRTFSALADGAQLRTAEFEGISYIVVPVIALIGNTVVRPMNADGPEYVPADELSQVPEGWNYRPCVMNHPNGGTTSANNPRTLELYRFGNVFDTRFEDGKLKMNAYLDPAKAEKVGPSAIRVIERCHAGESVEVSVGAYISAERVQGTAPNGDQYVSIWRDVVPDHLAFLEEGATGACSVEMGCGAPRIAQQSQQPNKPRPQLRAAEDKMKDKAKKQSILTRLLSHMRVAQTEDELSDGDIHNSLWTALSESEPGFNWIEQVFQESGTVVYSVTTNNFRDIFFYRRTFVVTEDGTVTLNDDREQVEPVTRWELVAAAATEPTTNETITQPCNCPKVASTTTGQPAQGGKMTTKEKAALIGRVIACGKNPFKEKDRKVLEALDDDQLGQLADVGNSKEEETETETTEPTPTPTPTPTPPPTPPPATVSANQSQALSAEDWERLAPADVRSLLSKYRAAEAAEKSELISAIGAVTDAYTQEELQALPTESLGKLAKALQIDSPKPSYLGRSGVVAATSSHKAPDPWADKKAAN